MFRGYTDKYIKWLQYQSLVVSRALHTHWLQAKVFHCTLFSLLSFISTSISCCHRIVTKPTRVIYWALEQIYFNFVCCKHHRFNGGRISPRPRKWRGSEGNHFTKCCQQDHKNKKKLRKLSFNNWNVNFKEVKFTRFPLCKTTLPNNLLEPRALPSPSMVTENNAAAQ